MRTVKKILKSKSGEGHLDTGVKIIIAVVIGALVLGGLYLLFSNVILPQLNTEVDGMMDYGSDGATVRRVLDDESGTYVLEYSYDGKHWQGAQMPNYGAGSSVYQLISGGESGKEQAALVKLGNNYNLIVSTDGINWTERFSFTAQSISHFYYGTSEPLPTNINKGKVICGNFDGERFVLRYCTSGLNYYTSTATTVNSWSKATWSDMITL